MTLDELGQRYRRYRLADPEAEEAMAGSLRRWGQLAPVVACVSSENLELLDGFKRQPAARLAGERIKADTAEPPQQPEPLRLEPSGCRDRLERGRGFSRFHPASAVT